MENQKDILITNTQIELPDNFEKYDKEMQSLILQYLGQLDHIETMSYKIAKTHLGSSFNLVKSNGFLKWRKK
jgi:hypothetical protein